MMLTWFNGREAAEIGSALADELAPRPESAGPQRSANGNAAEAMKQLLRRADSEVRPLQLNFYKKAKFFNAFKWRLIENGVAKKVADEVTRLFGRASFAASNIRGGSRTRRPRRPIGPTRPRRSTSLFVATNPSSRAPTPRQPPSMSKRSSSTPGTQRRSTILDRPCRTSAATKRRSAAFARR